MLHAAPTLLLLLLLPIIQLILGLKALHIETILETAAKEESELRKHQQAELKRSWDSAKAERDARPKSPVLDPLLAGKAVDTLYIVMPFVVDLLSTIWSFSFKNAR